MLHEQVVTRERVNYVENAGSEGRVARSGSVKPLYRGTQVVWYIFGVLAALLTIRFLLQALDANTGAGFTAFILNVTQPFVAPFVAVFRPAQVSGAVIEWTTLLAILVYWLLAYALSSLFVMGRPVSEREAETRLREEDRATI